jgi:hypothetical protein
MITSLKLFCEQIKNFNYNETPGWIGLIRGGEVGGLWDTCLERMCAQGVTWNCHPGLKRLLCLLCFSVLPVQPYDTMGSVSIE